MIWNWVGVVVATAAGAGAENAGRARRDTKKMGFIMVRC